MKTVIFHETSSLYFVSSLDAFDEVQSGPPLGFLVPILPGWSSALTTLLNQSFW